MATDNKFTELIKQWLDTPADERDYTVGALYLLKLSGNQIMYRNIMANPGRKADFIEYNIRKYHNFRVHNSALGCRRTLTLYRVSHKCRSIKIDKAVAVFDTVAIPVYTKRFFHLIVCIKLMLHTQEERVNIDAPEIISIVFIHALQLTAVEHSNPFHAQLLQASPDHPQLPLPRHIPKILIH